MDSRDAKKLASLTLALKDNNGKIIKSAEAPIIESTLGEHGFDISKASQEIGLFSFDPGYSATAAYTSKITYIDGDAGILKHRGYDIADLVEKKSFIDVVHLLLKGSLPSAAEYKDLHTRVVDAMRIAVEQVSHILHGFSQEAHPMGILIATFARLATVYHNECESSNREDCINRWAIIAIGRLCGLTVAIYRYKMGKDFILPRQDLDFSGNLINMMFGDDSKDWSKAMVAMDKMLILHADHEQNASTSAVRLVGSTGANLFASISAGIAALWGPLHGGANEEVIKMLQQIEDPANVKTYLQKVRSKEVKLMGFGHRVYRNYDPRALAIKKYCDAVFTELDEKGNKMLAIALELERQALSDEYFISRKLFPNVDFYSGILYTAIGIPTILFTPLFAVARVSGWASQWKEMNFSPENRINRPRQIYTGDVNKKIA